MYAKLKKYFGRKVVKIQSKQELIPCSEKHSGVSPAASEKEHPLMFRTIRHSKIP